MEGQLVSGTLNQLAERLVEAAGLTDSVSSLAEMPGSWTNQMWLIDLRSGLRLVMRQYGWPHSSPDLDRPAKELYLHRLLREAGVPVAAILSHIQEAEVSAALMAFLPGEPLGDVTTEIPTADRDDAWRSCGSALRRAHNIRFPAGTHGVIVGSRVEPAADTWGNWMMAALAGHARCLYQRHRVKFDLSRLTSVVERAAPVLNAHEPSLLHNDPHVWNVLVHDSGAGWRCSGWLDWEYAWVGDPVWDLTRLDVWRDVPSGSTPEAFWEGYGERPKEPNYSLYLMSLYLWQANVQLSDRSPDPTETQTKALEYVGELDRHVADLEAKVANGAAT
jgi:aminoglycoside phosphotransferase (APT) family kinase protein